jgi:hypothetical protein
MVQVRRIDNRRALDYWYAADDVSQLDYLLDSTMNVARVWFSLEDDISVKLDDEPHMSRARMLGTNTEGERLSSRLIGARRS